MRSKRQNLIKAMVFLANVGMAACGYPPLPSVTSDVRDSGAADSSPVAVCGNGITEQGESCDDGNNSACGGCKAGCQIRVPPATALGSIIAAAALASGGNIADGDNFTLNDGFHPAITFEFDVGGDGAVGAGNVKISLVGDGSEDAAAVAAKMITAITAQSSRLDISATPGGTDGEEVLLKNGHLSSKGNTTIGHASTHTDTINVSFTFVDFTGGASGDCAAGVGCKDNTDCTSGACDPTTHVCR